jgi:hypothetical protein
LQQVENADSSQTKQMLEETVLHHLYTAVISLASELVAQYNLSPFTDLNELFTREALPSELHELAMARADSTSWLYNLMKQHKRMLLSGLMDNNVHSGLISSQSDYSSLFANYLNEIEKFVQRMRLLYQEN